MFDTKDQSHAGYYSAQQTALLLLDWHAAFVGLAKADIEAENATKLADWARSKGIRVIHCLIDVKGEVLPTTKDAGRLRGMIESVKQNIDGAKEPVALANTNEKLFVRRPGHVSAFRSPGLEAYLHEQGIKSLLLSGISTSSCVMRTAVAAPDLDFVTTVISDACKDPHEASHDFVMERIVSSRGHVATAAEFQAGFEKAESER